MTRILGFLVCVLGIGASIGWSQSVPDTELRPDSSWSAGNAACSLRVGSELVRWTVGDSGEVRKVVNGQVLARYVIGKGLFDLSSVSFSDSTHGWIVGGKHEDPEGGRGVVFRTSTGGYGPETWTATFPVIRHDINVPFLKVQAVDAMRVWVTCGDGYALHSSDGGMNWLVVSKHPTSDTDGQAQSQGASR